MRTSIFWQNFSQDGRLQLLSSPCLSSLKCHHFPTTFHPMVCPTYRPVLQGLGEKAHFPWVALHCESHFLCPAGWSWDQWRGNGNESNKELVVLWAVEASCVRPVLGAEGTDVVATLASPQLLVAPWWFFYIAGNDFGAGTLAQDEEPPQHVGITGSGSGLQAPAQRSGDIDVSLALTAKWGPFWGRGTFLGTLLMLWESLLQADFPSCSS